MIRALMAVLPLSAALAFAMPAGAVAQPAATGAPGRPDTAIPPPAPATASETSETSGPSGPSGRKLPPPSYPVYPQLDYSCSDPQGRRVPLGTVICISASCQTWTARCELSMTNVIWRKLHDGCPGM